MTSLKQKLEEASKDFWESPMFGTKVNIQSILNRFPPASENNSRQIVKGKLERMSKAPSESKAQDLESLGITCDYQNSDVGEPPQRFNK